MRLIAHHVHRTAQVGWHRFTKGGFVPRQVKSRTRGYVW